MHLVPRFSAPHPVFLLLTIFSLLPPRGNTENQTCLQSPRLRLQHEFCFGLGQHIAHSILTRLSLLRTLRPLHDELCLSFTPDCSNSPSRRSCYWNIYASLPPLVSSPRVKVRLNSQRKMRLGVEINPPICTRDALS